LALSVPDEGYSRNGFCALNLISTFLFVVIRFSCEHMVEEVKITCEKHQASVIILHIALDIT